MAAQNHSAGDHCVNSIYQNIIQPVYAGILALTVLVILCIYIKNYCESKLEITVPIFMSGVLFYISCSFAFISIAMRISPVCQNATLVGNLYTLTLAFYVLQYFILVGKMYYRVFIIFKGTTMKLSIVNNAIFCTLYILEITAGTFACYCWATHHPLRLVTGITVGVLSFALTVLLAVSLMSKLLMVHKSVADGSHKNQELLKVITKTALLLCMSLSISICTIIMLSVSDVFHVLCLDFPRNVVFCIDIFSNCIFIALTYNYYDPVYQKLCKKCDTKCQQLWTSCTGTKNLVHLEITVASNKQCNSRTNLSRPSPRLTTSRIESKPDFTLQTSAGSKSAEPVCDQPQSPSQSEQSD